MIVPAAIVHDNFYTRDGSRTITVEVRLNGQDNGMEKTVKWIPIEFVNLEYKKRLVKMPPRR